MNKIYRRLWSTARQCWVVASELTAPRGKAASTVGGSALLVALSMLPDVGIGNVQAYYYETCQSPSQHNCVPFMAHVEGSQPNTLVAGSSSYMMLGMSSHMQGNYSTLFGNWSRSVGDNNTVFGFDARARQSNSAVFGARSEADGNGAVAVGTRAFAHGGMSIAMGYAARTVEGAGISRIAIGNDATAGTPGWTGAIAIGGRSKAEYDSLALGYEAKVTGVGSVALGRGALATEDYVVSVGSAAQPRRVVYVEDGNVTQYSMDAVNGRQLLGVRDTAEKGVSDAAAAQRTATGANNRAIAAKSTADQALANTKLVTQTSAGSAIRIGGENTGNVLTVSNKNGDLRYLNGVRNGALSASSTDAVTGQQLFATNQAVTAAGERAGRALAEASALARTVASGTAPTDTNKAVASAAGALAGGAGATASGGAALAFGQDSRAQGRQSVAMGQNAKAEGWASFAVGAGAHSQAESGMALGYNARVIGEGAKFAVALGERASASHANAVALGAGSVTNGGHQVSVGNATEKRRIVNVANGLVSAASNEAVTGQQLFATNNSVTTVQNTANAAKATADSALGKANVLGGLISQVAAGGNVRVGSENSGTVLDVRNKAGANRVINGVAAGRVGTNSDEVITGRQLYSTETRINTVIRTAVGAETIATRAEGKADALAGLVSQESPTGKLRLGGENTGTVLDVRNKSNANRTLSGLADGAVNAASTEAVTGKQLFATNDKVQVNEAVLATHTRDLAAQSGRIGDNRRDLDTLRSEFEGFDPDLDGVVKFAADGSVDVAGGKVHGVAAGDVSSAASNDAVNGGQLFATNERISSMEYGGRFFKIGTDEYSEDAYAGWFGVAIGESAEASRLGEGGVALGGFARAMGTNSVALGRGSQVVQTATKGFALGAGSRVDAEGGVALGADSRVLAAARGSVAIGEGSIADVAGTVSVGGVGLERRVTNVGRGVGLSDASTVAQLDDALMTLGGGGGIDGSGNIIAPAYNVQGGTQNNVGDALAALDSAVVTADSRVDNLEGKLRSVFQDGPSVRADGLNQLVLAGANGSVLTNLADGRIAAGSRDAVTGSQLFEAKQDIARNRDDLNYLRGERDGVLSRGLMAAQQGNVIDYGGARLTGVADGVISANSRDAVNGRQLFPLQESFEKMQHRDRFFKIGIDELSEDASAGPAGVAIGDSAVASPAGEGGVAMGAFAKALGINSVALGRGSYVSESAAYGQSFGTGSHALAEYGLSYGAWSDVGVGASRSVALGVHSRAAEVDVVSIGNDWLQRRIVNLANGRNATDAATVGQLRGALATLGGDVDTNGNVITPTFNVQGGQQSTLNEALSTLDFAAVTGTARTDRIESQLRSVFQDSPTVRNDGLNQLTFAGANGMVLSNVANGVIAAGSRDAVNGGQLHTMQQQLNGRMDGLEQRIDGQPPAPQARAMTVAAADAATASTALPATPAADEPTAPTPPPLAKDDRAVADTGNAPTSSPQPQADAPKPESPKPQVDTAELEKMLARANEYSDGVAREVDARLDKMDKRFNRMAAMSSAQTAMAMNTAGLATYNRLGAGVGYAEGESAMAVGYQRVLNDKGSATFSLNGAFTNSGEQSVGLGVGIGW